MVKPKYIEMFSISLSVFFGKSPNINYVCGKCGNCNNGRISIFAIKQDRPYLQCKFCEEINDMQIEMCGD